ncbi:hypothetical protein H257_07304 [Aphanomyces astaci]|uniref:DDE Tnp4 domain-containing protein n=1 Tax=Aphanomyces astaci TaxID=112090 RepID=W4GHU6_APHAT|nr:hypothetical protein H257_07304 [Aphanomyces astaci]ETV79237.1 hypothetical protein H257_07304 [Aphanomyces astaci]|eukprot:XP_009831078.1 hypothetical protein H257_07304 [Aphanomyces astaci]
MPQLSERAAVLADLDSMIRHVVAGWPGSVHDSTVWASSSPARHPDSFFDANQYKAGNSGFALCLRMLTPYRLPYAAESGNDAFNTAHTSLRVVCEHGNGRATGVPTGRGGLSGVSVGRMGSSTSNGQMLSNLLSMV